MTNNNITIGIVQPGRLGDIFICLPIAKHYSDMGFIIKWPVFDYLADMIQSRVKYVDFIPIASNIYTCVSEAKKNLATISNCVIFDIAATFPGSDITSSYVTQGEGFGDLKFDEFKYRHCNVPFDKKWTLTFDRNADSEDQLYSLYVKSNRYAVVGLNHSRGRANVRVETNKEIVEINDQHNIFDWIKILENADELILVDSAMSNLVEQLNLTNKKWLIKKEGQPLPVYKNDWIIE